MNVFADTIQKLLEYCSSVFANNPPTHKHFLMLDNHLEINVVYKHVYNRPTINSIVKPTVIMGSMSYKLVLITFSDWSRILFTMGLKLSKQFFQVFLFRKTIQSSFSLAHLTQYQKYSFPFLCIIPKRLFCPHSSVMQLSK